MRKILVAVVVFLGGIAFLLGVAFWFREDLARYAAGRLLSDGQLTLARLQGLQVSSGKLTVAELELLLHESGQRVVITGLDAGFHFTSALSAPVLETVTVASVQMLAEPSAASGTDDNAFDAGESGTRISEWLALLREFPLAGIIVNELSHPQRAEPLALELQRGAGTLNVRIASGALRLQTRFTQADALAEARLEIMLTRGDETVGDFLLALQPMAGIHALTGRGQLDIADLNALLGELDQAPLPLPLHSAQLDWDIAGSIADDLQGAIGGRATETFVFGLQAGSTVTLPAALASGAGAVRVEFTDRMELTVTSGAGLVISQGRLPVHVTSSWQEEAAEVLAVLTLDNCALAVDAGCALTFAGDASLGAYALAGVVNLTSAGMGKYAIESQGLTLGGLPEWFPGFDVSATLTVEGDTLAFNTPLRLREGPAASAITLDGTYDFASSVARIHGTLPELMFMEEGSALSSWFSNWPYHFDVLTGAVAGELDVTLQSGVVTGTASGKLINLGGFYEDFFFRGVNGALQAVIDTTGALPVTVPPLTLTAAGFDVGLPMENLEMEFSLDREGVLHIDHFLTRVLDGTVSAADLTFDFNRERNELLVQFAGLQMARMLDLVEYEGVEALGAVSGEIPLTLTPNGVEVAAGMLRADAPGGVIRYLGAATGTTGNAGLDLMNEALSNYQFESLTSGIEYTPDGELLLDMKLQGGNPDMQNGQRINLNLNLSDNIPALLESLQAARAIEDFLAEQYE